MGKHLDLVGHRYGRLTVVQKLGKTKHHQFRWECRCACGTTAVVVTGALRSGNTTSCGCIRKKMNPVRTILHRHTTNGGKSREYQSWAAMKGRCFRPKDTNYKYYGGRGITVCERWLKFEDFLADMGPRPAGKTLDRIDPDGNYEPGNVKWADATEQSNNRRTYGP